MEAGGSLTGTLIIGCGGRSLPTDEDTAGGGDGVAGSTVASSTHTAKGGETGFS